MITEEMINNAKKQINNYKGFNQSKELDYNFLLSTTLSPIKLPERKIGKYSIVKHLKKKNDILTVVSARNWLMMGYKQQTIKLPYDRIIHQLKKDGQGLLMSDSPQEMFLQYEEYKNAVGTVLVGGLGLGMYASMIARKDCVERVVVVEIDKDVIDLTNPLKHTNLTPKQKKKIEIVHMDIHDYLKTSHEKFDYIYIDIHYRTGAMEYIDTVLPLRKILEKRFPDTPASFWGEEEMEAQYIENYDTKTL